MSSKGLIVLVFITGAGIGSVCTWQLLKRKYEQIAQEEIDFCKKRLMPHEKMLKKLGRAFYKALQDGLKKVT